MWFRCDEKFGEIKHSQRQQSIWESQADGLCVHDRLTATSALLSLSCASASKKPFSMVHLCRMAITWSNSGLMMPKSDFFREFISKKIFREWRAHNYISACYLYDYDSMRCILLHTSQVAFLEKLKLDDIQKNCYKPNVQNSPLIARYCPLLAF